MATKRERRWAVVQRLKMEKGCRRCGYAEHPAALCFHHLNEGTAKAFGIRSREMSRPMQDIVNEIRKCEVLCHNCHMVEHHT